ncbi:hypothetical protein [Parasedimentitalea denitrificans]|nr:hypothetical protein [Sedimentitalea sp. CY04]
MLRVNFVVIGGAAVGLHGHRRDRKDLDILVSPEDENLDRLVDLDLTWRTFRQRDIDDWKVSSEAIQMPIRGVDLLKSTCSVPIEKVFSERVIFEVEGLSIPTISKAHLITEKRCTATETDLTDVKALEGCKKI